MLFALQAGSSSLHCLSACGHLATRQHPCRLLSSSDQTSVWPRMLPTCHFWKCPVTSRKHSPLLVPLPLLPQLFPHPCDDTFSVFPPRSVGVGQGSTLSLFPSLPNAGCPCQFFSLNPEEGNNCLVPHSL